jgi:hypothetical protein
MGSRLAHRLLLVALAAALALVVIPSSTGSVLIARSATNIKLMLVKDGSEVKALMKFKQHGVQRYVLAWGAINARAHPTCGKLHGPQCGPKQDEMDHMRLSPTGHYAEKILRMPDKCGNYDGPKLGWLVAACRAPDGSYWALQVWVRLHKGCTPESAGVPELRLSHWQGPLAKLVLQQSWKKSKRIYYDHVWGQFMYRGQPVYGLNWDNLGVPLDGYGRVLYVDTFDSPCGPNKWVRDEGGLSKPWNGQFCLTMWFAHANRQGEMYRATAMGPGVTPDIFLAPFEANHVFDLATQQEAFDSLTLLSKGSKFCIPQAVR